MGLKFSSLFRRLPGSTRSSSVIRLRITASKWDNSLPNRSGNSLWRNPSKKTRRRTRLKFKVNGGKKGVQIRRNTETISHLREMGCFCVNLSQKKNDLRFQYNFQ